MATTNVNMANHGGSKSMIENMEKYHKYLAENYEGGTERFFSPTGFLNSFEKTVELDVRRARQTVFVSDMDDATVKLQPVVAGSEGVFDLSAEPGSGKTSLLPFRFPTKKVAIALPTPFDAWSAFLMATGEARLQLKGLKLGPSSAKVVFTDSYMAARAIMSGYIDFDVMIVDECDSQRGVTAFLAEVKVPGKVLIRMSATNAMKEARTMKSAKFRVVTDNAMPDVRSGVQPLANYVKTHHKHRSLVLMPDAQSADELATHLPDGSLIYSRSNLADIARAVTNQDGPKLYISDDVCARGLNLNLDALFDTQLVAEHSVIRVTTEAEYIQRMGRVGRNKPGWYFSPGLDCTEVGVSDMDTVRHNVTRAIAGVTQLGRQDLVVSSSEARDLMTAVQEPFKQLASLRMVAVKSRSHSIGSSKSRQQSPNRRNRDSAISSRTSSSSDSQTVQAPSWLWFFSGNPEKARNTKANDFYLVKGSKNYSMVRRRSSGESTNEGKSRSGSIASGFVPQITSSNGYSNHRATLPLAESAPYAVARREKGAQALAPLSPALPHSPPIVDLTMLEYDLDWPALIRDRLAMGGDLPTLVPPHSWRHTASGGIGTNWFHRLDAISVAEMEFSESEFEVVCRAWNKLVAANWVKRTPGLSSQSDVHRLEFCARYFQSYFMLASANA